jgi:hypothetical protein
VPAVVPRLARPGAGIVRYATTLVTERGRPDIDPSMAGGLAEPGQAEVTATRLVGRGGGLTPAGDDVLAGFLVAAHAVWTSRAGDPRPGHVRRPNNAPVGRLAPVRGTR